MDQGLAALVGAVVGAAAGIGGGIAGTRLNLNHERRMWLRNKQAERLETFNNALVEASLYAGWFDTDTRRFELSDSQVARVSDAIGDLIVAANGLLLYSSAEVIAAAEEVSQVFEQGVRSSGEDQAELIRRFRALADEATRLVRKELGAS